MKPSPGPTCASRQGRASGTTPVKTEAQQAVLMTHRTRDFLVRQQTQLSVAPQVRFQRNALRAHLAEYGVVAPKGVHNVGRLLALADVAALPEAARLSIRLLADQFRNTHTRIEEFIAMVKAEAQGNPVVKRLQTVPGIGPITASASAGVGPITASVPNVSNVKAARDLAGSC